MIPIKQQLYQLCLTFIDERLHAAKTALHDVRESSNGETKSSAGDKYETGKAMAQIELDRLSAQLNELLQIRQILISLDSKPATTKAQQGSLVIR